MPTLARQDFRLIMIWNWVLICIGVAMTVWLVAASISGDANWGVPLTTFLATLSVIGREIARRRGRGE